MKTAYDSTRLVRQYKLRHQQFIKLRLVLLETEIEYPSTLDPVTHLIITLHVVFVKGCNRIHLEMKPPRQGSAGTLFEGLVCLPGSGPEVETRDGPEVAAGLIEFYS